jgi:FkbM family methyltransferase
VIGDWPVNLTADRVRFHRSQPRWEIERLTSMHDRLSPGDVIVDVGSECGDFPALWTTWGCRVVCVEPNPAYWPAIRAHFEANDATPLVCWVGFASDAGRASRWPVDWIGLATDVGGPVWPACSLGEIRPDDGFRHLALDDCPTLTLDTLCAGLKVDAITIDVEGSELRVLKGAHRVLTQDRPHSVWVSVHTDLAWMDEHYPGETFDALEEFMVSCGYQPGITLAVDHERHVLWQQ